MGRRITTDILGNVHVTGNFSGGTITFDSTTLTNASTDDIFVAKYDGAGNELWANGTGGTSSQTGMVIITDLSGNVFLTGVFQSTTIPFGSTSLTNPCS